MQCKTVSILSQYFSITTFMLKVLKDISLSPLDNIHKTQSTWKKHSLILGSKARENVKIIYEFSQELGNTVIIRDIHIYRHRHWYTVSANKHQVKAWKCLVAQSYPPLCDPMECSPPDSSLCLWNSPGKNTGVGWHALLQSTRYLLIYCWLSIQWNS